MRNTPVITKPIAQKDIFVGTLNPNALSKPILKRKTINKSYEQISQLTEQLEEIKKENAILQEQLDSMVNAEKPTPFCQFKKWEIDFQDRLKDREKELSAFSRYIDTFRTQANPTFVRIDAAKYRRPNFDSICVSLLVSNPEKYFFNKDDLVQINQQLAILIDQQADALKLLTARLNLFTSFQNKFTAQNTLNSLRKNEIPTTMYAEAPTRALELKTKRKMLSAELAVLIKNRRELVKLKKEKRDKKRRKRNRIKMSIKINSVIRGFLDRQKVKKLHHAAVLIQKVWRGYIQRWYEREADGGFDRKRFKMVKIFKHRINPDGEDQEYYEYEEEEIKEALIKPKKHDRQKFKKHRKNKNKNKNKNENENVENKEEEEEEEEKIEEEEDVEEEEEEEEEEEKHDEKDDENADADFENKGEIHILDHEGIVDITNNETNIEEEEEINDNDENEKDETEVGNENQSGNENKNDAEDLNENDAEDLNENENDAEDLNENNVEGQEADDNSQEV